MSSPIVFTLSVRAVHFARTSWSDLGGTYRSAEGKASPGELTYPVGVNCLLILILQYAYADDLLS